VGNKAVSIVAPFAALSRFAVIISVTAVLWGCSTGPYQSQIAELNKGLLTAQSGLTALDNQQRTAEAVALASNGQYLRHKSCNLKVPPVKDPNNCNLWISDTQPLLVSSHMSTGLKLMQGFVDYGNNLNTLAAAKDINDLNSGITKLNSNIGSLAKTAGGAAAFVPYVAPALGALAVVFNQYLEYQRVHAMRSAIISMDSTVDLAVAILAKEARLVQELAFEDRYAQLNQKIGFIARAGSTWNGETIDLVESTIQGYGSLKALANNDVGAPFISLGIAHKQLVAAAQNPQFSLQDAMAAIAAFAQQAEALYAATQPKAPPPTAKPTTPTKKG
jgi:hypothetical protein